MIELIEQTVNKIDSLIKEQLPESKYQFELYDLTTNTKHFRGLNEPFHWGSVYKLFVVAEIIKMMDDGIVKPNSTLNLNKKLYSHGNGILKYMTDLDNLSYLDACKMVMAVSDNLCADELLDKVGFDRLNNFFRKAGCTSSILSVNLDKMVKDLFTINEHFSATYYQSDSYFNHFETSLNDLLRFNSSTVSDINRCFNFIMTGYLSDIGFERFKECLKLPNQYSRLSYYVLYSQYLLKGKTGTLANGIVNNENAAIINKNNNHVYGYFALLTKENKKRYFQTNDTFGLIGLEIVKLYEQLFPQVN